MLTTPSKKYIFCLGGQENTLALARYGDKIGMKAIYFDFEKTPASFSKYVQFEKLERMTEDEVFSRVLNTKHNLREDKPFIFFNSDNFVRFAANHRLGLEREFNFTIPTQKIIECALDKSRMDEILPSDVLPVSFPVENRNQLLSLTPPLIVKARDTSRERTFKTMVLSSSSDFMSFAQKNDGNLKDFLFQRLVRERGGRLISVFFYRNTEGGFYSVAIERERMNPYWGGVGCLIKAIKWDFTEFIEKILRQMDYLGFGEIDLFEYEGKITIFDLNVRLPSWAFLAKILGVDLIGIYLRDLSNGAVSIVENKKENSNRCIKAIDLINDMEVVFHPRKGLLFKRMLTFKEYLNSIRDVRYFFIFNLIDFRPFLYKMMREFSNVFWKKNRLDS